MPAENIELSEELVDKLSWLSRIKLSEEEKIKLLAEIKIILSYIDEILTLEAGSEEITHLAQGRVREDIKLNSTETGMELLHQSIIEDGYVKAPKVYKG